MEPECQVEAVPVEPHLQTKMRPVSTLGIVQKLLSIGRLALRNTAYVTAQIKCGP